MERKIDYQNIADGFANAFHNTPFESWKVSFDSLAQRKKLRIEQLLAQADLGETKPLHGPARLKKYEAKLKLLQQVDLTELDAGRTLPAQQGESVRSGVSLSEEALSRIKRYRKAATSKISEQLANAVSAVELAIQDLYDERSCLKKDDRFPSFVNPARQADFEVLLKALRDQAWIEDLSLDDILEHWRNGKQIKWERTQVELAVMIRELNFRGFIVENDFYVLAVKILKFKSRSKPENLHRNLSRTASKLLKGKKEDEVFKFIDQLDL